jgi:hypothetical protein
MLVDLVVCLVFLCPLTIGECPMKTATMTLLLSAALFWGGFMWAQEAPSTPNEPAGSRDGTVSPPQTQPFAPSGGVALPAVDPTDVLSLYNGAAALEGWSAERQASSVCVYASTELPGVFAIGTFASDLGCELEGAYVDHWYFADPRDALNALFERSGWAGAAPEVHAQLAIQGVREVLLSFRSEAGSAPSVTADGAGGVSVSIEFHNPVGDLNIDYGTDEINVTVDHTGQVTSR